MNPKEFGWAEDQTVTVTNPTKNDYAFKVHSKDYIVKAGQTAKMAGYIAWVYTYGLACQMAQDEHQFSHWNEEGFRQKYYERIVIGSDEAVQTVVVESAVETLNSDDEPEYGPAAGDVEPDIKQEAPRRGRRPKA